MNISRVIASFRLERQRASRCIVRSFHATFACDMAPDAASYDRWTKDSLVERVRYLEDQLKRSVAPSSGEYDSRAKAAGGTEASARGHLKRTSRRDKRDKKDKAVDPTKYSTRFIALKLAYLGKNYNGYEYQNSAALTTIEEELWKALVKSCLIFPDRPDEVNFGPWDYSKCGRTDRGVSAFGQVIGIRVRSNRPVPKPAADVEETVEETTVDTDTPAWDPIADEIPYPRVLNRILPPDIRVLAWCPDPPADFSARYSCRERQYRYYFTQPAFAPVPSSLEGPRDAKVTKPGWLDIGAMRQAAKLFEGLHDFRNVCKIDPGKQITNFVRRVFESDIVAVDDAASALPYLSDPELRPSGTSQGGYPQVWYFHVRGSAFLWHQIRHMVSIIFAVGQGLESPSVVSELLDVQNQAGRPSYTMADDVPLVLWDCVFPDLETVEPHHEQDWASDKRLEDAINWLWMGEDNALHLHGSIGLVNQIWENWRGKKMDEILANQLLDCVASKPDLRLGLERARASKQTTSQRVFEGGNNARFAGTYVPIMKKPLSMTPAEANDKWAQSKGFSSAEDLARHGNNWRTAIKTAKVGQPAQGTR